MIRVLRRLFTYHHRSAGSAGARAAISAPRRAFRHVARRLVWVGLPPILALTACSTGPVSPDTAELANIRQSYQVPRSSPAAFVRAFNTYCLNGPTDPGAAETRLRSAGYVPLPGRQRSSARAFVADDLRPLVAVSDRMCLVRAKARTGQTERLERHITSALPNATAVDPKAFGPTIEQAWRVPGPAIVATERQFDVNVYTYSAIYFRERAP